MPDRLGPVRERLGLPPMAGQLPLAAALVADSVGDGMFVPFAIAYFLKTTSLSLPVIGSGLSIAGFIAVGSVPVAGVMIDRFRPASMVITGNLVSAAAFAGYLAVVHAWQMVSLALVAAVGGRLFWTANLALAGDTFDGAARQRWFAFQRAARSAGSGLGGLLAAAAVGSGTETGYRLLAAANAASFVLAAVLVLGWSRGRSPGDPERAGGAPSRAGRPAATARGGLGGYRAALSDRPLLLLAAVNFLFVLCMLALDVLLVVYLTRDLHQPAWVGGVLFAANTAVTAAGQTVTSRLVQPLRPARALQLAAAAWAASFLLLWALSAVPGPAMIAGAFFAIAVFTVAEMIQGPIVNTLVVAAAPDALRLRYIAVNQLSWALASAAAPGVLSWLFHLGTAWPWAALAAACVASALTLGRLDRRMPPTRVASAAAGQGTGHPAH